MSTLTRTPIRAARCAGSLTAIVLAVATLTTLSAGPALAAGFLINESSASGLGNAFAGGAAAAQDASTLWSNVAGLSRIGTGQAVGALHLITPSMKLRPGAAAAALQQALGGNGGDAGGLNVVPNTFLAMPMGRELTVGLGLSSPFGLVTEYDDGWIGRFQALRSDIMTLNVNPGASLKVSNNLALGLGVNFQRMLATFTNQANYSAALLGAAAQAGITPGSAAHTAIAQATAGLESHVRVSGDDNAWGWNVGLLWDIDRERRLGLHYRSALRYDITGGVSFSNPTPSVPAALAPTVAALANGVNAAALFDSGISAKVKLPPIVNVSYVGAIDKQWELLVDAQWTGWSTLKDLTFVRSNGAILQSTPENFKDAWKLAVGTNFRRSDSWMFRGGLAYDQSPVQEAFRTARLPDASRTWLTTGMQYRWDRSTRLDFGAAYVWVKSASIHESGHPPNVAASGLIKGSYKSNTVILSGQLTYEF
jgi:long-chain fatty acid transport protein